MACTPGQMQETLLDGPRPRRGTLGRSNDAFIGNLPGRLRSLAMITNSDSQGLEVLLVEARNMNLRQPRQDMD
eukprot:9468161-Alexandrium_andersonii.AAC.1